jgi:hypothetical protein
VGQQQQPGDVVVTQTDMLAQIGAQTIEITMLRGQVNQAQQIIAQQAERIAQLETAVADNEQNSGEQGSGEEDQAPTPIRNVPEEAPDAE